MYRVKEKFYDCEYNNQVISKMKLPNIEAVYRAFNGMLKHAFEEENGRKNTHSCFCHHNMLQHGIFLTKDMVHSDDGENCIVAPYVISSGTAKPISYSLFDDGSIKTDIQLFDSNFKGEVDPKMSIGDVCEKIIDEIRFCDGDTIVFFALIQKHDETTDRYYAEVNMDRIDLIPGLHSQIRIYSGFEIVDGCFGVRNPQPGGYAWVHISRKNNRKKYTLPRFKSTQKLLIVDDTLVKRFSSYEAFEAAAQSYGCQKEDPEKVKARQKHRHSPFPNWK